MKERLFDAHHELENRHWWFRGRRRAILALGEELLHPGDRIVDVGCGTGADIGAFPAHYDRYGIDVSDRAIALARTTYPGVTFEAGPAPTTGADVLGGADLVLLCDVLEHVADDSCFLTGLLNTMKTGSNLLITVPADPGLWGPHDEVYGHFRRYTTGSLSAVWAGCDVEVHLLAPFNRRLYPAARVVRALSATRGKGMGSESSDLVLPWSPVNSLLERVFAGETEQLLRALRRGRKRLPGRGLSLVAVLKRGKVLSSGAQREDGRGGGHE